MTVNSKSVDDGGSRIIACRESKSIPKKSVCSRREEGWELACSQVSACSSLQNFFRLCRQCMPYLDMMLQFILCLSCRALKKSQASRGSLIPVSLPGDSVLQAYLENNYSMFSHTCRAHWELGLTPNSISPWLLETPIVTVYHSGVWAPGLASVPVITTQLLRIQLE